MSGIYRLITARVRKGPTRSPLKDLREHTRRPKNYGWRKPGSNRLDFSVHNPAKRRNFDCLHNLCHLMFAGGIDIEEKGFS